MRTHDTPAPVRASAALDQPTPASRLDRMLSDPLIRLVMASDKVEEAEIRRLASRVAARHILPPPPNSLLAKPRDCAGCA